MYVPFAMGVLEAVRWRKRTLFAFEATGIAVGLYLLYAIAARPLVAELVGGHIVYDSPHFYLVPVMVLYLAATCVSGFCSSHGFVRLFGVLSLCRSLRRMSFMSERSSRSSASLRRS
jgi:hypothetical protein